MIVANAITIAIATGITIKIAAIIAIAITVGAASDHDNVQRTVRAAERAAVRAPPSRVTTYTRLRMCMRVVGVGGRQPVGVGCGCRRVIRTLHSREGDAALAKHG